MISEVKNMDCMEYMQQFPDNYFELAIVDPPYGAFDKMIHGGGNSKKMRNEMSKWDYKPHQNYFDELFRVTQNQIVWGSNYFINELPLSTRWLCWDKGKLNNFPEFELAWMSFNKPSRMFRYHRVDAYINDIDIKIHPTQKPIKLYRWLLQNYAKPNDKILDTHLGSGSSRIAADMQGFDFYACELDKYYFDKSCKRFDEYKQQLKLL